MGQSCCSASGDSPNERDPNLQPRVLSGRAESEVCVTTAVKGGLQESDWEFETDAHELGPLLLHFDVNKTVIFSDVGIGRSMEDGIRESISELFWGTITQENGKSVWTHTRSKPSCAPPEGFDGCELMSYSQYCKKMVPIKALREELVRSWELVTDEEAREEMNNILKSALEKMELPSHVQFSKESEEAGLTDSTLRMLPAVFALVALLQRARRTFAVLFRSFGNDHSKIKQEWNAFCEMKHPVFSHLLEGVGAMDGSVPGIPDRRIAQNHTLYRDKDGPMLVLDTLSNGPVGEKSWDNWAKQKPKPKEDVRGGRAFVKEELKAVQIVEGMPAFQEWIQSHVWAERTSFIKDDWAWWHWNGQRADAGKLLTLIPAKEGQHKINQLFFDDNVELEDARIIDCRHVNGDPIAFKTARDNYIAKVNPVEVLIDEDYFFKAVQRLTRERTGAGYAGAFREFCVSRNMGMLGAKGESNSRSGCSCCPLSCASNAGSLRGDVFDSPYSLSLVFCYAQMMPSKRNNLSNEKGNSEAVGMELPSITDVYNDTVDVLLQRTLRLRQTSGVDTSHMSKIVEECRHILEKIAMAMHVEQQTSISTSAAAAALSSGRRDTWENLKSAMALQHVKLFNELSTGVNFMTKGLQSFLAAGELSRPGGGSRLPSLDTLLTDPWWVQMLDMLAEKWPSCFVDRIQGMVRDCTLPNGNSFLHIAAASGNVPVFSLLSLFPQEQQQLLSSKTSDTQQTPLHIAAGKGNNLLCTLMIERKASIDSEDKEGRWPMHVAMQHARFQTAKLLADHWLAQKPQAKFASNGGSKKLASQVLDVGTPFSETEFLEAAQSIFVELSYFDKSGDTVEKKRALGALLAVYWIASNKYDLFARGQPVEARLSSESWGKLQEWVRGTVRLTGSAATVQAMLVFVSIMSVGKIKAFRMAFTPETQEFNEALIRVLERVPVAFPSFARLEEKSQSLILSAMKASEFNFGQFLQAENTPANLLVVQNISKGGDTSMLSFFLFKIFAAMCGILGMKSLEGSIFMGEKMYGNFKLGLDVLEYLNSEGAPQVFNRFLAQRANAQGITYNATNLESRALVRLACLTRVFEANGAQEVTTAFKQLSLPEQKDLVTFLNADGITEKPAFLLYNSPNLLAGRNKKIGMKNAIQKLLQVYKAAAKEYGGSAASVVTIMCDELAAFAGKCEDPEIFAFTDFEVSRAAGAKGDTQAIVSFKD